MLRRLLTSGGDIRTTLAMLLLEIPIILFSLSMHELAHGFVAYKCGDNTAKAFGRLTLNPLKHLDPIGTLCMFLMGFGWAKPVPVNMRYFKKPKRDLVLVSIAGPAANFILALIFALLHTGLNAVVFMNDGYNFLTGQYYSTAVGVVALLFQLGIIMNLYLGIFNLVPLPPLDGSKILMCALPGQAAAKYARVQAYTRYIFLGIVALSWVAPVVSNILFLPVSWPADRLADLLINGLSNLVLKLM